MGAIGSMLQGGAELGVVAGQEGAAEELAEEAQSQIPRPDDAAKSSQWISKCPGEAAGRTSQKRSTERMTTTRADEGEEARIAVRPSQEEEEGQDEMQEDQRDAEPSPSLPGGAAGTRGSPRGDCRPR